jgi:hypothetical protein
MFVPFNGRNGTASREAVVMASYQLSGFLSKTSPVGKGSLMAVISPGCHPGEPTDSPLWKILHNHYPDFKTGYDEDCEIQYGFFRPVVDEVVEEYLRSGALCEVFAGHAAPTISGGIDLCRPSLFHHSFLVWLFA